MNPHSLSKLVSLMPQIVAWAEEQSDEIARKGSPLSKKGIEIARAMGVTRPELVRVAFVDKIDPPEDGELSAAASETGLISESTAGMTLGHSIVIRNDKREDVGLLSHELRHVHQYEQAGSIKAFLETYVKQVAVHGYPDAPYEVDARKYQLSGT